MVSFSRLLSVGDHPISIRTPDCRSCGFLGSDYAVSDNVNQNIRTRRTIPCRSSVPFLFAELRYVVYSPFNYPAESISNAMTNLQTVVFCDFDGTIARRDVGYSLFHYFSGGRNDELIPDWKAGRLSTRECLLLEAAMVHAKEEEVYRFLEQFELNRGFIEFERLCRANNVELFVVSDGLDFYIRYILKRNNLEQLPVVANRGKVENGGITVEFIHRNRNCQRCGSCKGERIQEYRNRQPQEVRVVFIGDGYSDACATTEADLVFAKKDLEQYCLINDINYYKYDDFFDVARELVKLGYLKDGQEGSLGGE